MPTEPDALTTVVAEALTEHWRSRHPVTRTPCSGCTAAVVAAVHDQQQPHPEVQSPAETERMTDPDALVELVREMIRDKGNHVDEWPDDEAAAYRDNGRFTRGNAAVQELRVAKGVAAIEAIIAAEVQHRLQKYLAAQVPMDTMCSWWARAEQREALNGELVIHGDGYDGGFEMFEVTDADRVWRNPKVYRVLEAAKVNDADQDRERGDHG